MDRHDTPAGFRRVDCSYDLRFVNQVALGVAGVVALLGWASRPLLARPSGAGVGLLLGSLLVAIPAHELLHLLGFRLAGAPASALGLGVVWKALTPFASCRVPLTRRGYAWAAALPGLVLGVAPMVLAVPLGSLALFAFGAAMTIGAAGDALAIWGLRRLPSQTLVVDHESRAGCMAFVPC
jgi:hypothetical protein